MCMLNVDAVHANDSCGYDAEVVYNAFFSFLSISFVNVCLSFYIFPQLSLYQNRLNIWGMTLDWKSKEREDERRKGPRGLEVSLIN